MTEKNSAGSPFDDLIAAPQHPLVPEGGMSLRADRQLRQELIDYRTVAGLTRGDVEARLDWSQSKLNRLENGQSPLKVADALAMLSVYGVSDETKQALVQKVRLTKTVPRNNPYKSILSALSRQYLECEADACRISIFQPDFIPDVMQTDSYADALTNVFFPDQIGDVAAEHTDLRHRRATYLLGKHGPRLNIILDEAVLHRAVGGEASPPDKKYDIMHVVLNGLKRLNTVAQNDPAPRINPQLNPAISIQVVPFEFGAYPSLKYPYTLIDFPDSIDKPMLHIESQLGKTLTDDGRIIAKYRTEFDKLTADIPGVEETSKILEYIQWSNQNHR